MAYLFGASDDIPRILAGVAEFAASNACTQTIVADTDGFVLESVGKVVLALGHGANKNTDTFRWAEGVDIITDSYHVSIETQRDLSAIWR